jgi:hypothetical protein
MVLFPDAVEGLVKIGKLVALVDKPDQLVKKA